MQINSEPTRRQLMDQVKQQIDEIKRLQKQAHYHYENGLKKDVEIESLRDALRWAAPYVKDDPRVSAIVKAALKKGE